MTMNSNAQAIEVSIDDSTISTLIDTTNLFSFELKAGFELTKYLRKHTREVGAMSKDEDFKKAMRTQLKSFSPKGDEVAAHIFAYYKAVNHIISGFLKVSKYINDTVISQNPANIQFSSIAKRLAGEIE